VRRPALSRRKRPFSICPASDARALKSGRSHIADIDRDEAIALRFGRGELPKRSCKNQEIRTMDAISRGLFRSFAVPPRLWPMAQMSASSFGAQAALGLDHRKLQPSRKQDRDAAVRR
jgi:hypothetical protein